MRIPRIYTELELPDPSQLPQQTVLTGSAANHVGRVLRMGPGRELKVFNGRVGGHFVASIDEVSKKQVLVTLQTFIHADNESPVNISLGQAISKGDRMDFTIQKAVELGVHSITPLWTARCDVKLSGDRLDKKVAHWQQVAISACEQSGRDYLPIIQRPRKLSEWLQDIRSDVRWVLDPRGKVAQQPSATVTEASLLVGPEGGLNEEEIKQAVHEGFEAKLIGPRVLRTETAALTAITLIQHQWGDF